MDGARSLSEDLAVKMLPPPISNLVSLGSILGLVHQKQRDWRLFLVESCIIHVRTLEFQTFMSSKRFCITLVLSLTDDLVFHDTASMEFNMIYSHENEGPLKGPEA